jgi:hypothetical protein
VAARRLRQRGSQLPASFLDYFNFIAATPTAMRHTRPSACSVHGVTRQACMHLRWRGLKWWAGGRLADGCVRVLGWGWGAMAGRMLGGVWGMGMSWEGL